MEYFSFKTQDTDRSISNCDSNLKPFKVIMTDDKGNQYTETNYAGYGVFGGKDFYVLLAEMNGYTTREEGIDLVFMEKERISPSLSESGKYFDGQSPKICELQGFFYE